MPQLQGRPHTWFCGAWTRYGFHEDGLMSGLAVVERPARGAGPPQRRGRGGRVSDATAAAPLIGIGQVRHARLRPARNGFAYPTYFLMLPMRSLRAQPRRRAARATASA